MTQNTQLQEAQGRLKSGFFGFWLRQWRTTLLVLILLILIGSYSAYQIPKESYPEINMGMITVTTVYPGASAGDINDLITEKIEDQIKNIEGIDKITSKSLDSVSSILANLDNDADSDEIASKIQDAIKKVNLPADAEDPTVTQVDTSSISNVLFSMVLYAKNPDFSIDYLKSKAEDLQSALEWGNAIDKIDIVGGKSAEIQVLIHQAKAESLGLPITRLANILQSYNSNQPLGTHTIGTMQYSFRIDGEAKSLAELEQLPIPLGNGKSVSLGSIATLKLSYNDKTRTIAGEMGGKQLETWSKAIVLTFSKKSSAGIIASANQAKEEIAAELQKYNYRDLGYFYTSDLGEQINKSYSDLAVNMISTLLIVFGIVILFIWGLESFLATISIPLAFFITFFVLNSMGYTMNMLTNFSLIICLGVAVDTATVIIQWASENIKLGYSPLHAALLSVKTYQNSLISGTATTVAVFIPIMSLPGILGSFLAYIPITIFVTLVASLFVSLTITPALFFKSLKNPTTYRKNEEAEKFLAQDAQMILTADRLEKQEETWTQQSDFRDRFLNPLVAKYDQWVTWLLQESKRRAIAVVAPILFLIFTAVFVMPQIGFVMMPAADNEFLSATLTAKVGMTEESLAAFAPQIDQVMEGIPELVNYHTVIDKNLITVEIRILPKETRKRTSFAIEQELADKLAPLNAQGLQVSVETKVNGPSGGSTIGIKLIAKSASDLDTLSAVARDFKSYLGSLPGAKNVTNSSEESPGQFVFELDKQKLALLGLSPANVAPELYLVLNGMKAGTLKMGTEMHDIKLKYQDFDSQVSPDVLMTTMINTPAGQLPLASIGNYVFKPAVSSISREKGEITITIWADLAENYKAETINTALYAYAESYEFPSGISYAAGGETQENADLITALFAGIALGVLIIFAILVLQFNSFTQPIIITYSIMMGFVGAVYGMFVTGNPYSMMFMIGFLALIGIVVNNAIILIDTANENRQREESVFHSIKESARSRLRPILSTTLTTVIGLATLTSDGFFAPLAYAIMFGLSFATVVTIFVIPVLYHDEDQIRTLIKRLMLKPALMLVMPMIGTGLLYLLSILFGFDLFGSLYGKSAIGALFLSVALFLIARELYNNRQGRQWWRQKILKLELVGGQTAVGRKILAYRLGIKFGLLILPVVIGMLVGAVFNLFGAEEMVASLARNLMIGMLYVLYFAANIYTFWVYDGQFLHDRWTDLKVCEQPTPKDQR